MGANGAPSGIASTWLCSRYSGMEPSMLSHSEESAVSGALLLDDPGSDWLEMSPPQSNWQ